MFFVNAILIKKPNLIENKLSFFFVNNIVHSRKTSLTSFIHPVASAQKLSKALPETLKMQILGKIFKASHNIDISKNRVQTLSHIFSGFLNLTICENFNMQTWIYR